MSEPVPRQIGPVSFHCIGRWVAVRVVHQVTDPLLRAHRQRPTVTPQRAASVP
jgi:hypothetical protein